MKPIFIHYFEASAYLIDGFVLKSIVVHSAPIVCCHRSLEF